MPIDTEEFTRWMQLIRADIYGVNTRLDVLNGRTRQNEKDIAVLNDRALEADDLPAGVSRRGTRKAAAAWGGGIASAVYGVIELVKWLNG